MNLAVFLIAGSMILVASLGAEQTGSLLGKPLSALIGSLDQYAIEVSQAKGAPTISPAAAKCALEHSELIDPTLPEVRRNDFPLIATLRLTHRDRPAEVRVVELCSLGFYRERPITYVFRYQLPKEKAETK